MIGYEKPIRVSREEMDRAHEEALEINQLVNEWRKRDENISPQETADKIIAEREMSDLEREKFAKGWGEKMMREILMSHPDVVKVEMAPRETDLHRKTDAFVEFKNGKRIGAQLTLVGFKELGENDLKTKLEEVIKQKSTTYFGKEEVPLTVVRGNYEEFIKAYDEWAVGGRKGMPLGHFSSGRKDRLSNEFIRMMAEVLSLKFRVKGNPRDKEWADYLDDLYKRHEEKRKRKPAAANAGRAN